MDQFVTYGREDAMERNAVKNRNYSGHGDTT
jgi:hypothetical protein